MAEAILNVQAPCAPRRLNATQFQCHSYRSKRQNGTGSGLSTSGKKDPRRLRSVLHRELYPGHGLLLTDSSTFTGITLTIPDSEIHLIQIDGGQDVLPSQATESVGVLYPGERIDLVVAWKDFVQGRSSELVISLDSE